MDKPAFTAREVGLTVLVLVAVFSFKLLLDGNLGTGAQNEGDVLPLARQYANPDWVPGDWYLNQPPGYRRLFQAIAGRAIETFGFLATSLVGRLVSYTLVAWGITRIGHQLGMRLPGLLLAAMLLVYVGRQSVAAKEWIVGGLEAKSIAYGLVVLAIAFLLKARYRWMALLLGLATSFHVLVGGWSFLVCFSWLALRGHGYLKNFAKLGAILGIYAIGSVFAVPPVLAQLLVPSPSSPISPNYIYVFIRLPHHLNPTSWHADWWVRPVVYILLLLLSVAWLQRQRTITKQPPQQHQAQRVLAEVTLLSLVPFLLGVAIAPFDTQGALLQYYPFRVGDVLLPLNGCLLLACAVEQAFTKRWRPVFIAGCLLLLLWLARENIDDLQQEWSAVQQFPGEEQRASPELNSLYAWIRTNTPPDATIISPPTEMYNLTWLTERPTIAKYKFLPQSKKGILEWYERLSDLSGGTSFWQLASPQKDARDEIRDAMENGYNTLNTAQAVSLMQKYQANYFVRTVEYPLNFPIAYQNERYILYQIP